MAQYQAPTPWNPGYDVPKYITAEPLGRGAFVTRQLPRGTFGPMPPDPSVWDRTGYQLPDYVKAEPIGRGTFTTKMLPRRTVPLFAPDIFQRPKKVRAARVVGSGAVVATGSSLDGCTLGDEAPQIAPAAPPPPPARSTLLPIAVLGGLAYLLWRA